MTPKPKRRPRLPTAEEYLGIRQRILEELEARGMSQSELARRVGRAAGSVHRTLSAPPSRAELQVAAMIQMLGNSPAGASPRRGSS